MHEHSDLHPRSSVSLHPAFVQFPRLSMSRPTWASTVSCRRVKKGDVMATGLFKFGFSRSKTRPSPSTLESEAEEITEEVDAHPGNYISFSDIWLLGQLLLARMCTTPAAA